MKVGLYVPADDTLGIDPRSGIVGRTFGPALSVEADVELYYEGNRYGYAGVHTYADRVRVAAARMVESYPTRARQLVAGVAVRVVGTYDLETGVIVVFDQDAKALAEWLGFAPEESTMEGLAESGELRLSDR